MTKITKTFKYIHKFNINKHKSYYLKGLQIHKLVKNYKGKANNLKNLFKANNFVTTTHTVRKMKNPNIVKVIKIFLKIPLKYRSNNKS